MCRLATDLCLSGFVANTPFGALIEAEGAPERLEDFESRLQTELPAPGWIASIERWDLSPRGEGGFEILPSEAGGEASALALPDLKVCPECLREVFDRADRRHRYPFANCTRCGPRYSILLRLPYDRANTTMARFPMCPDCRREYEDPADRRFHAQPIACPACGPWLRLLASDGRLLAEAEDALRLAEEALLEGRIVALKGIGGFQLLVDATNEAAVRRLRERKAREHKPFAVLARDLATVGAWAFVSPEEAAAMESSAGPIVLLKRRDGAPLAPSVAPENPLLGVMLPTTPLHALLASDLGLPLVATSGNLSDEPICIGEEEALRRLGGVADLFLSHDRPIHRHVDDSVVRVARGRPMVLRRARGYAPAPVPVETADRPVLAYGAHLKSAVCLVVGDWAFLSQHVGDLETPEAVHALERVAGELPGLYGAAPAEVVRDLHPDYASSRLAEAQPVSCLRVQHHLAHVLALLAESSLEEPALGVAWDGTGLGPDGTVWGGEFLVVDGRVARRVACLRPFRLLGGDHAARDARRTLASLWWTARGLEEPLPAPLASVVSPSEVQAWRAAWAASVNTAVCTSAGRLFDAGAALCGLGWKNRYEGDLPMRLEHLSGGAAEDGPRLPLQDGRPMLVDWEPLLPLLLEEGLSPRERSARFHGSLARAVADVAGAIGLRTVALSGGCFQNGVLLERTAELLEARGFRPVWSQRVPPNDGGIALGQAIAAVRRVRLEV